mgnify:FL=1
MRTYEMKTVLSSVLLLIMMMVSSVSLSKDEVVKKTSKKEPVEKPIEEKSPQVESKSILGIFGGSESETLSDETNADRTDQDKVTLDNKPTSINTEIKEATRDKKDKELPNKTQPKETLPSAAKYWISRVDEVVSSLESDEQAQTNALYREMSRAFDKYRTQYKAREWRNSSHTDSGSGSGTYAVPKSKSDLFFTLETLYKQRLRLLDNTSESIVEEVTGTGVAGVKEFNRELSFLEMTLRYRIATLPDIIIKFLDDMLTAPLPTIRLFVEFIVAIFAYRFWQKWAPKGLFDLRKKFMRARPRTKRNLRLTKLVWYFDQLRNPIALLILLSLIFGFVKDPSLTFFIEVGRIFMSWILWSWLGVLLINAVIARSSSTIKKTTSDLILKTLKILGVWLIISGLNLEIISRYVGEGTLYAWAFLLCEFLLVIVLIALVAIWRSTIITSCELEPQQNSVTKLVLSHRNGFASYVYSLYGAFFLLQLHFKKVLIDWLANFHTGQQILDSLLGLEMAKAYLQEKDDADLEPISAEIQEKFEACGNVIINQMGGSLLRKILAKIDKNVGGAIIVVSESGGGKSTLLRRIAKDSDKKTIMVSCPKEGLDALIEELARKIHLDSDMQTGRIVFEELRKRQIDVLIIDDVQRLIRPYVGGQDELDKLASYLVAVPDLMLVLSTNSATWQYIVRARAHRIFDRNIFRLPSWTPDHIGTLIENSCTAMDVHPDFSKVVIPRQYDDSNYDNPKDRVFSGFIRILHTAAGGNPRVALGLWAKSLFITSKDQYVVRLPRLASSSELENATLTVLLVLRVICQSEIINNDDIVKSLQLTDAEVFGALRLIVLNEWVDYYDEKYYSINWYWRKEIIRVLARQNLMPRYV